MNAVLAAIARNGQEWSFDAYLDFGVIGEQPVEVFYTHHYGLKHNDAFMAPEPEYCEVTSVMWNNKDIAGLLNDNLIEDLSFEALEDWQS